MKKHIIIFGGSRAYGHTMEATKQIIAQIESPTLIDLSQHQVSDFDYNHKNDNDDFYNIMQKVIKHETLILATPIYWYTMSATMKRFVDRFTDLLSIHKELGRKLRNKELAVICSYGTHPEGKDGFERAFVNTADYLGMKYLGCYFHYSGDLTDILANNQSQLVKFIAALK